MQLTDTEATIIFSAEGSMLIIGERINSSRQPVSQAIERHDIEFIQQEAVKQTEARADYIDVNAGTFMKKEKAKVYRETKQ